MSLLPYVIRYRRKRKVARRQDPLPRIAWSFSLVVSLFVVFSIFITGFYATQLFSDLPPIQHLEILLSPQQGSLLQPTQFFDRTGTVLLTSLEIPGIQRRWLNNPGSGEAQLQFDPQSPLARVFRAWVSPPRFNSLSSTVTSLFSPTLDTIPQHLAYDLLLWNEPEGWQKYMRAKILGAQIQQRYGEEQSFIWYLNSLQFGPSLYGVETASQAYFSKPAMKLNIVEAAALVAASTSPAIHPLNAPQIIRQRTGEILGQALKARLVFQDELPLLDLNQLRFNPSIESLDFPQPPYIELAVQQLESTIPNSRLLRGGYKIITTLDADLQTNAECVAKTQLERLINSPSSPLPADCPAALLLPTFQSTTASADQPPFGVEILLMDVPTGEILAVASLKQDPANPSIFQTTSLSPHTAGTILTPLIYLAGFSRGTQPATMLWDIPPSDIKSTLPNPDGKFHGPVRTRIALANDLLSPANTLFNQIGSETILNISNQFGFHLNPAIDSTSKNAGLSEFLFASRLSLPEVAQMFSVFGRQGILRGWSQMSQSMNENSALHPPVVKAVEDQEGNILYDIEAADKSTILVRPVISAQLAYLMSDVLSDETARWLTLGHPNPFEIGRTVSAKIGRLPDGNAPWSIGYTPQRLVGVWLGSSAQTTTLPPSASMGIWHALIQYSSKNLPAQKWDVPEGIQTLTVCDPSGLLPDEDCPATVEEVFIQGNEPHQTDTLFQTYLVNEQTGRLATIFTPVEFVKEKRYMLVPPEAKAWAEAEGLLLPPKEYDIIQSPLKSSPHSVISSPAMFAYVRDKVSIYGTANGDGFQYYRLQVGKGLFPRQWIQIVENNRPVTDGELGEWDTQGLSGLYTLQLQVVGKENRLETALVQLTVDNQPPEVIIQQPSQKQSYSLKDTPSILFTFQPGDDLGLKQMDIYLDNKKISTLVQPPYVYPWVAEVGNHRLKVIVFDLAGNQNQAEIDFQITR